MNLNAFSALQQLFSGRYRSKITWKDAIDFFAAPEMKAKSSDTGAEITIVFRGKTAAFQRIEGRDEVGKENLKLLKAFLVSVRLDEGFFL